MIGAVAGISQNFKNTYWIHVGFLTRDVSADILEMDIGHSQEIRFIMMIISLMGNNHAVAFIRLGQKINMSISTTTGTLLILSLISSFLFPLAEYLVIGIAFLAAGITLLRISKR